MSGLLGAVASRLQRWIIPGFIVLFVLFAALSLMRDEWRIPLTDIERGQQDTPLGLTLGLDLQGGVHLVYETVDPNPTPEQLNGVVQIIRTRVDQFGVAEPLIQTLGANRIVVQLPGVQDVQAAKDLIGAPAVLDFRELIPIPIEPGEDTGATIDSASDDATDAEATPEAEPTIDDGAESTPVPADPTPTNAAESTAGPSDGTTSAPKLANVSPSIAAQTTPEPTTVTTPLPSATATVTPETTATEGPTEPVVETPTPEPDAEFRLEWEIARAVVDGEEVELTGDRLEPGSAQVGFNPTTGAPEVYFQMDSQGREAFRLVSRRLVGQLMGIFLDDEAILTPRIQSEIPTSPRITGLDLAEAQILAIQLNAGAFPIPLEKEPILERDVDAFLGADALERGLRAGMVGILLVALFMVLYYRMNGVVAAVALIIYAILVLGTFKSIPVVLTLSGLAAFVLSFGFAVDANVLIFERMKEELRAGRSMGSAIDIGFNRAWPAIRDGNFTTLIIAAILFWFGERLGASLVQGFALTLAIGIVLSMFSALVITRRLLRLVTNFEPLRKTRFYIP
ncbi:MAG: protein translocase subunit SecD [Chloroflexi bacterium]|nr:protein translocase subunit SecD [Chloroflexota bacterium]